MPDQPADIEFVPEVPLPTGGPGAGSKLRVIAEVLQDKPGEWAIVRRRTTANGSGLSAMKQRLEHLGCEATTRRIGDELLLYARWPEAVAS